MKGVLLICFLALTALSLVAWRLQPEAGPAGRVALVWTSDDNPLRKEQTNLFNKLSPKDNIALDPANGDLSKVIVQSLAGVGPDVLDCKDGFEISAYVKSGIALDITDELKKSGIDVAKDTFVGSQVTCIYNGRVYGVPTNIAADGVWYQRDMFREEGVPYPKGPMHWPEFIKIAQRMTKRNAAGEVTQYGFFFDWYMWMTFVDGFGGTVYNEDGTRCTLDTPQVIAAIQLMQDLTYKYKVSPSPTQEAAMATSGGWGSGNLTYFGAKRGAMALGGRWWLAQLRGYKGLELGVCEAPFDSVEAFRGYGRGTMINKNGHHIEAALRFIRFLASPEYNQLVNDQADGVTAFPAFAQGERFLHNPAHPEEDSNDVWLRITQHAVPDRTSQFVDGAISTRLIQLQLDLVQAGEKTAAQAMRDAATSVNDEIRKSLKEDPDLMAQYRKLTGRDGP